MFKGRNLLIVTKHEKEKVIAPILEAKFGFNCFISPNFDTDVLGTFSGEIERKNDPITTARNKCLMAMELTHCDIAVASEGSFGTHPSFFFVPADDEFLILIDKKNDLEIIARELSTDTNFNAAEVKTEQELKDFTKKVKFPSHGLIIKKDKDDFSEMVKGIKDTEALNNTFKHFVSTYGKAFIETDMRAMNNPTRMKVIEKLTIKLANKLNSLCANCETPGFEVTDAKLGLPCELCGFPTNSALSLIYSCQKCTYKKEEKYPNGKLTENPMYCDNCNP